MLSLPSASKTVEVQIIDTTAEMRNLPSSTFFQPGINGWDTWNGPCYSFLITHTDSRDGTRRVVFDLGVRKDWKNLMPGVVQTMEGWAEQCGFSIKVDKDVSEVLNGNGVELRDIEAVIWRFVGRFACLMRVMREVDG
jgi:hypothetical protein